MTRNPGFDPSGGGPTANQEVVVKITRGVSIGRWELTTTHEALPPRNTADHGLAASLRPPNRLLHIWEIQRGHQIGGGRLLLGGRPTISFCRA